MVHALEEHKVCLPFLIEPLEIEQQVDNDIP